LSARLRLAFAADGLAIQDIDVVAGHQFRDVGMPEVADEPPTPLDEYLHSIASARCWVALGDSNEVIGFVQVDVVDGNAHIEQVSVLPAHQGRGVGRALVEVACSWAVALGLPAVTLTTFLDVPWNEPLYRHLGFHRLAGSDIGPELAAVVAAETERGLHPTRRVCMRRWLQPH
jgi:ribosomal protein S18 acetylase RimI-like enzyme